jgi:predicted P-loop ATPase
VQEYLEFLETAANVEPADINSLATTYLGTEEPLYDRMMKVMVLGAVARRLEPGCKFDLVVVLKGKQGIKKSSFWKTLASPGWFTESVPDDDKDLLLNLHSTWIFELAELESVTNKRSAGKLKNIISTSSDLLRVPYGKATERRPRASIFVSSVNGDSFLRDETGERRYLVIECPQDPGKGESIDLEAVLRNRDQIWKAAVQAYRAGEKPYLDFEDQHESNVRNQEFQVEHPWGFPLDKWLRPRTQEYADWANQKEEGWRTSAPKEFLITQALIGSGVREEKSLQKADEGHMATLLRQRGYVSSQKTVKGIRGRYWSKPDDGFGGGARHIHL